LGTHLHNFGARIKHQPLLANERSKKAVDRLILVLLPALIGLSLMSPAVKIPQQIYESYRDAVVQIGVGPNFSGNGFIVSSDGTIVTANHVVTTRESGFKQYAEGLRVRVEINGAVTMYPAILIDAPVADEQTNFDSARLKIEAKNLPHVSLGDWNEAEIGGEVTVLTSFPTTGVLMLQGPVSGKSANPLFSSPVNTIYFQCPVRNGFSGSPLFSSKGNVVGIVDTKVFGTTPALEELRQKWEKTRQSGGGVSIMGIDAAQNSLELIDNLNQNLISGLGSAVDIGYIKKRLSN